MKIIGANTYVLVFPQNLFFGSRRPYFREPNVSNISAKRFTGFVGYERLNALFVCFYVLAYL